MSVRIGINGFGRIGRSVLRILAERPDFEVVAINDLYDNEHLAYLLKYDTVMGVFEKEVSTDEDSMTVAGRRIVMTAEKDPARIPWGRHRVDVVVEATGKLTRRAELEKHLAAGAKKVVLTVPAKDEIDAMIVLGVNDAELAPRASHRLERLVHDQLPGAAGPGPRRSLRHRRGLHDDGPRLHQRPASRRRPALRPAPQPRGGREHHSDDDRRGEGGRARSSRRWPAASTAWPCACRCPTARSWT